MTITGTPVTNERGALVTRRLYRLVEFGLGRNANITRVDLRSMGNLRRTPEEFLADCPELRLLNMSGLVRLGTIRNLLSLERESLCRRLSRVYTRGPPVMDQPNLCL